MNKLFVTSLMREPTVGASGRNSLVNLVDNITCKEFEALFSLRETKEWWLFSSLSFSISLYS